MITHNKPCLDSKDIEAISSVVKDGQLAHGAIVQKFENTLTRYLGAGGQSSVVSSGTAALYLALWVLGVGPQDEVILPTYVCSALLNAIYMLGAMPVLVDVNIEDFNISYKGTKNAITRNTKVIIIPHTYGVPVELKQFKSLGIPIIEDCAQSFGAEYEGQKTGTIGDISVFSFYATKLLTTGHGGMVYSKKKSLIEKIRDYREFDYRRIYYPRFNFKMTDLQAALGLSQLRKINFFLCRREAIAQQYSSTLQKYRIQSQVQSAVGRRVYYRYVICSRKIRQLKREFLKRRIKTIIPIENWELLHRLLRRPLKFFKNAERLSVSTLSLPIYPSMKDIEINAVCKALSDICERIS